MARRKPISVKAQAGPFDDLKNVQWWVMIAAIVVVGGAALISRSQRVIPERAANVPAAATAVPVAGDDVAQPSNLQWASPPPFTIDPENIDYQAIITLPNGEVTIDLFEEESPITVNNFVFLANNGFYDGVTFHRVMGDFMAQGGDPTGTGSGGPGYSFEDEVDNGLAFDREGLLAMANIGPNTNGSQFFITYVPTPHLDGRHTIFGEVTSGYGLVQRIPERNPAAATEPGLAIVTVRIVETPKSPEQ